MARCPEAIDPLAEERALEAFRDARRQAGTTRPRSGDDWRPGWRQRLRGTWRVALGTAVASGALGGVAYATFVTLPAGHDDDHQPAPTATSAGLGGQASVSPTGRRPPSAATPPTTSRPPHAADPADLAHCRAYLHVPAGAGRHLGSHQHLVEAAGGADQVPQYCARVVADDDARNREAKDEEQAKDVGQGKDEGQGDGEGLGNGEGKRKGQGKDANHPGNDLTGDEAGYAPLSPDPEDPGGPGAEDGGTGSPSPSVDPDPSSTPQPDPSSTPQPAPTGEPSTSPSARDAASPPASRQQAERTRHTPAGHTPTSHAHTGHAHTGHVKRPRHA